jgi:neopullulanase
MQPVGNKLFIGKKTQTNAYMKLLNTIYIVAFFCIVNPSFLSAQIQHIEPLNWWVGMKSPNLQLLVNGQNIGETTPIINYAGVTIKKITKADSKDYLFIDLVISKNTKPGTVIISFKRNNKIVATFNYALLARQQVAAKFKGFNSSDVIYLIVPDRFANGDTANDIVAGMKETTINRSFDGGRHGGDIRGIINHLDYIKDMGFTAIWPTPLLENDMPAYSYHGYAITNHYKVDPRFGTLDDYKELAAKAKQKGIKLIFDEVLNHSGTGYWWMNDLPFKNWLNKPDSFVVTNHRRTVNQDLYASAYDKDLMNNGWFDKSMPDMNGQNPFMANYLIQSTIWWIETLQLGGVRQDTYGYSDKTFLKNWSCAILSEYPNFSTVGEEWSVNPVIASYWQKGKVNKDGYTSCLTTTMDFPLQAALVDALKEPDEPNYGNGLPKLYEALANDIVYDNPNNIMLLGDNHDMDRLFMQLNQDVELTKMALTYLLTIRGIPQIYYGTEVLMDNTGYHKNDGLIRSDFPGGWEEDTVNAFTGNGLPDAKKNMQAYIKQLLNWRKTNSVFATGKTLHFAPFNGVYVYFRYNDKKTIMVAMNKNEREVLIDTKRFAEILKDKSTATNIITGESISNTKEFRIAAKSATVFEIE